MNDPRRPHFRFYPSAYEPGQAFDPSKEPCSVCGLASDWRYNGVIYTRQPPKGVCAVCIASRRLGTHLGVRFSLHDITLDGAATDLEAELLERTPGVACFNPFAWPVRDGAPLAFIGYGDNDKLQNDAEVQAAVAAAGRDCGIDDVAMPTPYALIFKELDGPHVEAVLDYD
jgi:uncharacterized protein CbrC (UPF0167 family)